MKSPEQDPVTNPPPGPPPTGSKDREFATIQRLVRTGGHDHTCRVHAEAFGDLGLQGTGVGIIPELRQVSRRQILEEYAWWRIPLVTVELEHPGLWTGRSLVEIPGNPTRRER